VEAFFWMLKTACSLIVTSYLAVYQMPVFIICAYILTGGGVMYFVHLDMWMSPVQVIPNTSKDQNFTTTQFCVG
jgi:hypothetical protein